MRSTWRPLPDDFQAIIRSAAAAGKITCEDEVFKLDFATSTVTGKNTGKSYPARKAALPPAPP